MDEFQKPVAPVAGDVIGAVESVLSSMHDPDPFVISLRFEIELCEQRLAGMRSLEEALEG